MQTSRLDRAQGCLLGQLSGDSLGSLVEFRSLEWIRETYPDGVWDLADGGTFNTLAGQPTDDSEMALALARTLAKAPVGRKSYSAQAAKKAYLAWLHSWPFDCGETTRRGLTGNPNPNSQANGALMRISPLGIYGAGKDSEKLAAWAMEDAGLTHPHPICGQVNALFVRAIAQAVHTGHGPEQLYGSIVEWAAAMDVDPLVREWVATAATSPPEEYLRKVGWVRIAFGNALWQLLHASSLEQAVADTVARGGDTDTNAAICGALLGAVHGRAAVPQRWQDAVLSCRPEKGRPGVHKPRPTDYWPVDALELAGQLLS